MAAPQGKGQVAAEPWNDCLQRMISLVALIDKDQRMLLLKRSDDLHCGGFWSLPGGKQQCDEDALACAQRELLEETAIHAHYWQQRHQWQYRYPDRTLSFTLFQAVYGGAALQCESPFQWQPVSALQRIDFPPANQPIPLQAAKWFVG